MSMDREDVLLAFRALKAGFPFDDLRKAVRKQNALPIRKPLAEVMRGELGAAESVLEPFRSSTARPDPRADRPLLDQISKIVVSEGVLTASEFERIASAVAAAPPSAIHAPIQVPPKLGECDVRWEMRRDAHSGVYHGWHPKHGDVALKIFRPGSAPEGLSVRLTEPHPGIVRMLEVGESEGFRFVVMEVVEGQPFSKLVRAKKLNPREALTLAEQAGRTLAELQDRGFFHGSLRSSDLFVDRERVRIKDFGGVGGSSSGDLRAYAEILYEAATGVPPYGPGETHDHPPPPAGSVNRALDPEADRLVGAAVGGRYPTLRALVEDLGRYLRGEPLLLPAPSRISRRAVVVAVSVVAVLAVAAAAWAISKSRKKRETPASPGRPEPKSPEKKEDSGKEDSGTQKTDPEKREPRRDDPAREAPMTPSEEYEIEEQCYRLSRSDVDELGRVTERALRRGPKAAWVEYYRARYLLAKDRNAEALLHADEAVRLKPDAILYVGLRFDALLKAGEVRRTLEDVRERIGKDYQKLNQHLKAVDDRLGRNSADGISFLERGVYWMHRPDFDRAEQDFTSAIDRGIRPALHFRARLREKRKRYREASEDVRKFLEAGPHAEAEALKAELEDRIR